MPRWPASSSARRVVVLVGGLIASVATWCARSRRIVGLAVHRGGLPVRPPAVLGPWCPDDDPEDQAQQPDTHQDVADRLQIKTVGHADRDRKPQYRANSDQRESCTDPHVAPPDMLRKGS